MRAFKVSLIIAGFLSIALSVVVVFPVCWIVTGLDNANDCMDSIVVKWIEIYKEYYHE